MLQAEIHKLLKRKLIWIMLPGILFCGLYYPISNIIWYCFNSEGSQTQLQYDLEQYESAKGILTDEKLESFIENYKSPKFDYSMQDFMEDGNVKKIDEFFPNIDFDIHFGYFYFWECQLRYLRSFMKYLFAFVIMAFSMLFTYEQECGMEEILLTAKNGRKQCMKAKIATAFFITNLLYLLVLILILAPLFLLTKGIGWDTSIQMSTGCTRWSVMDINNLTLLFHIVFMSFLAINVILLITLLASFLAKSPVAAMCVTLGILLFVRPDTIAVTFSDNAIVDGITSLTPLNVIDVQNLVNQVPIQFGGIKIHCLTIAEISYTLLLVVGSVIFFRVLPKHQKYYAS